MSTTSLIDYYSGNHTVSGLNLRQHSISILDCRNDNGCPAGMGYRRGKSQKAAKPAELLARRTAWMMARVVHSAAAWPISVRL